MSLEPDEMEHLKRGLGRDPTPTEIHIVAAEWSEHCSYKSSKRHLSCLPRDGPAVISERGFDSGVLDVGDGYVVTVHIESHNHPSAVEPYGGAATGVGGVIRDILSAGTRPIAILDGLRFGDIRNDARARWLLRNAVAGIADYGNCLGIPTVGGELEFDESYADYALVDVSAIGFGRRDRLIRNRAVPGDVVVILGGPTGRDGIGGSQFASDSLESQDRSAVQIPDPFMEKLIIEAVLEARNQNLIHAMKDLGGGGLSCAVSETADALSVGIDMDVSRLHLREADMLPGEIMTSESQERMLIITPEAKLARLQEICGKFRIRCSAIGSVTGDGIMHVRSGQDTLASMPAGVVANAQLLDRPSRRPEYLSSLPGDDGIMPPEDLSDALLRLLTSPNISSRVWAYGQYDHEVGIRTVVRPGGDAAVLRLDNGRYLAATMDGNPKHCYLDPRQGAVGCFEEACRNVVCTGARPVGMVDHLQFGSPEDPEIFWTFKEALNGISEFARHINVPCVGGKVSFYNETPRGPIKPTPVIGVLGLSSYVLRPSAIKEGSVLIILGGTRDELGGSEYLEHIHGLVGGRCPGVDPAASVRNMSCVLDLIGKSLLEAAHDCSKGGLAVAVSEMCVASDIGCRVDLEQVPSDDMAAHRLLFSESHSRYLLVARPEHVERIAEILRHSGAPHGIAGTFGDRSIIFGGRSDVARLSVDKTRNLWMISLGDLVGSG